MSNLFADLKNLHSLSQNSLYPPLAITAKINSDQFDSTYCY